MRFARIFALAPDCHTEGRYARVWRRHFYRGLQGALPDVVLPAGLDWGWARPASQAALSSTERTACSERLWTQIRAAHDERGLDAVISYCFSSDVEPGLVERTRELGVPWIDFFCDGTYAFDRVEALARVTSLNWFPESAAAARYRALGRPSLCRPYALDPAGLPEAVCGTARHALGFVGAPTGNRVLWLAGMAALGCRAAVRGEGWGRGPGLRPGVRLGERLLTRALLPLVRAGGGTPLGEEEMPTFLASCRVVLGLNQGRDERGVYRSYLKLRDVELPGHGCCYLTQDNEDVRAAFDVGREVLTFRHAAEAAARVRELVRNPGAARAMGRAARRRVLAEHTWTARLAELARAL